MTQRFYRIIRDTAPTLEDFKPAKDLGKPLRNPRLVREWAEGISVFDSLDYAIDSARAFRFRAGRWIVALAVPIDGSVEIRQTGREVNHFTLYASPERIMSFVEGDVVSAGDISHDS